MPPEVPYCRPLLTPFVRFSPPSSPESQLDMPVSHKLDLRGSKKMKFLGKKLIPLLVFVLSTLSILRLLRITITTSSSSPPSHALPPSLHPSDVQNTTKSRHSISANAAILTKKELKFLKNLIIQKTPCNLLVFGLHRQYLKLSSINAGGITVFLEDDHDKISTIRANSNMTRIYKVEYQTPAKKAYQLLKHSRRNHACAPSTVLLQQSACKLALTNLPQQVYEHNWDVVVVDGPIGNTPEAPGRMAAIYSAGVMARAGNTTHVVVHDVDRTVEKWFSWEFLCEENLVSSKGRFWNFRIKGHSNSTSFCTPGTAQIGQ